ncbi:hypothetical protein GOBAR_DD20987 [Gossypium barbadense]|nr:hypothetical protein GOBAR_DD20987 [Gossypium barbadense]
MYFILPFPSETNSGSFSYLVKLGKKKLLTEGKVEILVGLLKLFVFLNLFWSFSGNWCIRCHRRRSQIGNSSSRRASTIPIRANGADSCTILSNSTSTIPIRANGADSCTILSNSTIGPDSPVKSGRNGMSVWIEGFRRSNVVSAYGILEYSYNKLVPGVGWFMA